jgi:hypothetical protein
MHAIKVLTFLEHFTQSVFRLSQRLSDFNKKSKPQSIFLLSFCHYLYVASRTNSKDGSAIMQYSQSNNINDLNKTANLSEL